LHDRAGLQADLGAVQLVLRDAFGQSVQLGEEAVERRLARSLLVPA
jgi:hypothetical protein